jgi:hypothetical protein
MVANLAGQHIPANTARNLVDKVTDEMTIYLTATT